MAQYVQTDRLVLCILVALCVAYYPLISFFLIYFPSKHLLEEVTLSPLQNMVHLNFLKFLPISNLTAGECKSNLITTEYCDSFKV